jgi:hypothetical protein
MSSFVAPFLGITALAAKDLTSAIARQVFVKSGKRTLSGRI